MLRSTDAGAHWTPVVAAAASITQLRADAGGAWAASLDGRLLRSTDDGVSWTEAATGAPVTALVDRAGGGVLRFGKAGVIK